MVEKIQDIVQVDLATLYNKVPMDTNKSLEDRWSVAEDNVYYEIFKVTEYYYSRLLLKCVEMPAYKVWSRHQNGGLSELKQWRREKCCWL